LEIKQKHQTGKETAIFVSVPASANEEEEEEEAEEEARGEEGNDHS
jgi:hypothetical protein